jgi:hypothetical protein
MRWEPFRAKMSTGKKSTETSRITVGVIGMSTQSTVFLEEPAVVLEGKEVKSVVFKELCT